MITTFFLLMLIPLTALLFYIHGKDKGKKEMLNLLFAGKTLENNGKLYSVKEISLQEARVR